MSSSADHSIYSGDHEAMYEAEHEERLRLESTKYPLEWGEVSHHNPGRESSESYCSSPVRAPPRNAPVDYRNTLDYTRMEFNDAQRKIANMEEQIVRLQDQVARLIDRKSTRLNSSHRSLSRMPSSA